MKRTMYNLTRAAKSITPAVRTNGTVNGSTVDRQISGASGTAEWHESALVVVSTGTITDGSHAVTVEHSDNGTDWTTATGADIQGTAPTVVAADDDKVFEIGYVGVKRYVRATVVTSGATSGGLFGAVVVLGFPSRAPISRS